MADALFYGSLNDMGRQMLIQRAAAMARIKGDHVQFVIASGSLDIGLHYLEQASDDRNLTDRYLTIVIWNGSEAIELPISEEFHSNGADHVAWDSADAIRFLT